MPCGQMCAAPAVRWTGLSLAEQDAFLDSLQENELTKKQMSETISTAFGKMISDLKNLFYPMVLAADESTPGPNYTSLQRMLTDAKYNELNSTVRSLACMHSADRLMRAGRLLHALPPEQSQLCKTPCVFTTREGRPSARKARRPRASSTNK